MPHHSHPSSVVPRRLGPARATAVRQHRRASGRPTALGRRSSARAFAGHLLVVLLTGCTGANVPPPPRASTSPAATIPAATTAPASPAAATTPAAAPRTSGTEVTVRVERRTTDAATARFAQDVMAVLQDARGWSRAGFRFVLDDDAPFTIVLAGGPVVDELCLPYDTAGSYSCQNGPVVALNADRWRTATPSWPGTLDEYRTMLVNHEVGHLLHLHHPSPQCPGDGFPAPVMLQQSSELGTCTPNPWPLPWEVDLAASRREPLAPPADHDVSDHRPVPPHQQQDLTHRAPG